MKRTTINFTSVLLWGLLVFFGMISIIVSQYRALKELTNTTVDQKVEIEKINAKLGLCRYENLTLEFLLKEERGRHHEKTKHP